MKLLRYGSPGEEKPGVPTSDGEIRDLSSAVSGQALPPESIEKLQNLNIFALPVVVG